MPAAATPMAFVRSVLAAYRKYRVDPSPALLEAGIPRALLQDSDARVTAAQFEALCRVAMQQLDDEALGWFSRRLPWGSYGLLCRASLSAPSLGVALKRWCRHHRLLTEDIDLQLLVDGDVATLRIDEHRRLGALREFCLVSCLRYVHGYACWLIDSRMALLETCLPLRRPPHGDVFSLLFPGPVTFGAERACMRFSARYLELPPCRDETAMRAMLQRALPLTVRQYRRDRLLADRARALIASHPEQPHDAGSLADSLSVSVRTLHRQLQEEGTSLQRIKNAVRLEQAAHRLRRGHEPIKKVALALGFASAKTFARAFRDWTGQSPGEYRAGAGGPQGAAAWARTARASVDTPSSKSTEPMKP